MFEWKTSGTKQFDNQIVKLKVSSAPHKASANSPNMNNQIRKTLAYLHQNHIVIPIDKASENVVTVYKRLYTLTLMKEIGIFIAITIATKLMK